MNNARFETTLTAGPEHIDELGHVNNAVWVQWIQQVAVAHWDLVADAAQKNAYYWVVVRHEIDYLHAAHLGDAIIARTWVGTASGIRFERHTELLRASDRRLLAKARTVWCPIDAATGMPARVRPEVRARFSSEAD